MKRVLNSGTVKLPQIWGNEVERLATIHATGLLGDEAIEFIFDENPAVLDHIKFRFEIKAPLLTFLTIQDSNLGTLNRLPEQDHPIAYLPPQFYKKGTRTFDLMDSKACNIYNTKLYNFYSAAINFYNNLLKDGMCKEQAQLVLPQGMLINFLWDVTAIELIEFIENNHSKSPETYGYCSTFVLYLEEHLPQVTKWLKNNKWHGSI